MKPVFVRGNVKAICPDCQAPTTFEYLTRDREFGKIVLEDHPTSGVNTTYKLLKCAVCQRGGIATVRYMSDYDYEHGTLLDFLPFSIENVPIPEDVPEDVKNEFREAELCASVRAFRAASALLRSTLEKTLKRNEYKQGNLQSKIDAACDEGIITSARKHKAHDDIRVLGNDVLHDEWRGVTDHEYERAHHYTQRILEDFYDDRPSVEKLLVEAGRISQAEEQSDTSSEGNG